MLLTRKEEHRIRVQLTMRRLLEHHLDAADYSGGQHPPGVVGRTQFALEGDSEKKREYKEAT